MCLWSVWYVCDECVMCDFYGVCGLCVCLCFVCVSVKCVVFVLCVFVTSV